MNTTTMQVPAIDVQSALDELRAQVHATGVSGEIPVVENKNFLRYFLRARGNVPDALQMVLNYAVCIPLHALFSCLFFFTSPSLITVKSLQKCQNLPLSLHTHRNGGRKAILVF